MSSKASKIIYIRLVKRIKERDNISYKEAEKIALAIIRKNFKERMKERD